jgi:hypothetical protein
MPPIALLRLLALSLLLSAVPVSAAPTSESAAAFTQAFVDELQRQAPQRRWTVKAPLELQSQDGKQQVFLDNAWAALRSGREDLASLVRQRLAVAERLDAVDAALSPEEIVPLLKPQSYLDAVRAQFLRVKPEGGELPIAHADWAEGLLLVYAQDQPAGMRMLSPKDAAALGADALRSLALENLGRLVRAQGGLRWQRQQGSGGAIVYRAQLDRNYEASAALLPGSMAGLELRGEPLVFALSRELVLLTGSDDAEGIALLRDVARRLLEQLPYAISAQPYRVRADGRWVRVAP